MKDLHKQWSHRWLNPKAASQESEIHGLGVFAKENIHKGETVGVLGGVIVYSSEIKDYWRDMGHVGIQIDDQFFIVPTTKEELEEKGVFNHSCSPNIGFSNSITLVAMCDIKVGDELVFDYAFSETTHESIKCHCGSSECREIITPHDWKNIKLQEKYGRYFSPYLRDKFRLSYVGV